MDLLPILERYHDAFLQQYADRIKPAHRRALQAMIDCRTPAYGEMQLACSDCDHQSRAFRSCGHRSCPRCQHHDTTRWLARQQNKLLPVPYFMVTFTLPAQLRAVAWHHQKTLYTLLFDCAVSTLKTFGANSRKLGGELGMTAVLHTHSRRLDYHPHVHVVVPAGSLNRARKQWKTLKGRYLFTQQNLAKVFRGRFLQALRNAGFTLPPGLPERWVVDCKAVGKGLPALTYLARYLYRGVISERNVLKDEDGHVTFRYKNSQTGHYETRREKGEHFLWLILQHVLPKGFRRARDFGFLHGNAKRLLQLIQWVLRVVLPHRQEPKRPAFLCARCHQPMRVRGFIPPRPRPG